MNLHFTYTEFDPTSDLRQGDILRRTDQVDDLLKSIYPRYAANTANKHFLVLTQSCDLVRRNGTAPDTRYISLAPVRPLTVALNRKIEELIDRAFSPELPVCTQQNRERLRSWLERLLNNNEASYFYLNKEPTKGLPDDSCAFLALSIAIKADLHYQTCLDARVLTLEASFQAKLGWLVGQMYSRIGTEDWLLEDMQKAISETLKGAVIGIDPRRLKVLKGKIADWTATHPGQTMDRGILTTLIGAIPRRKDEIVDRLIDLLKSNELVDTGKELLTRNAITNDPIITNLIPE
jgi:hypothetical protein